MSTTLLLADDHAIVREGLRLLLGTQPDMRVVGEADNGRDAARLAQALHPDIVLMDIAMPKLNGIDATSLIRATSPSSQVIILSMYSASEHIVRSFDAGARGFILKESAGSELLDAVRAVRGGRYYISRKIPEHLISDYLRHGKPHRARSPLDHLSPREREILQLVVEGHSSVEIGTVLGLSPKTVETYRSRLMQKIGIDNIPGLVKFAIQCGLTPLK